MFHTTFESLAGYGVTEFGRPGRLSGDPKCEHSKIYLLNYAALATHKYVQIIKLLQLFTAINHNVNNKGE